jgi:hypothetical protein
VAAVDGVDGAAEASVVVDSAAAAAVEDLVAVSVEAATLAEEAQEVAGREPYE